MTLPTTIVELLSPVGTAMEVLVPPTILTEVVAPVGAILILAKPEYRDFLIFFRGIERVRYRGQVHAGDVLVVEARVKRLRNRKGVLDGRATVDGRIVANGTMTFALGTCKDIE